MGLHRNRPHCWTIVLLLSALSVSAGSDLRVVEAVKNRDHAALRSLLQQHADVNIPETDGATALAWAAHWDDLEAADLLIAAGAKLNAANDYGVTPLSLACTNASTRMVEKLLDAGADPNSALKTGETALMTCARTGNPDAVNLLLAHKANPSAKVARGGQTALMWAVAEKHPEAARVLIEHGADVHARSKGGFTPLLFAARAGDLDSARLLLQAGADVNERASDGITPLLVAASSAKAEALAEFFLENGADANAADANGITPLHYAVQRGISVVGAAAVLMPDQPQLVKTLLLHGANPNAQITRDFEPNTRPDYAARTTLVGATPLFLAAACADVNAMRLLAAGAANPSITTNDRLTPLMALAALGAEAPGGNAADAARLLLDLGAELNAADKDGQTALHLAASAGADAIVKLLAEKGANLEAKNKFGQTPLNLARGESADKQSGAHAHASTANLLLRLGAASTAPSPAASPAGAAQQK